LPQPLVELEPVLRVLGEMPDVHVVLKVHPSDSLSFYQDFVQNLPCADNIEVVKDCEVQALLHTADLLVCIISNMIVMAAILGTPTLVCDFSGKRRPLDFVAEGLSFGCFSQSEIAPMVRRLLFDPAAAQEWRQMRRTALRGFNGPNDGQSHSRVVDLVMAVAGKMELCPTTS
jgi:predicted glycosyltransferase